MPSSIDHLFILCSVGGNEASALVSLGLKEGSPNTHPGQGTACRRFFFSNAYLELAWVSDPTEARSEAALPTRLWERWSRRKEGACPFGVVLRPGDDAIDADPPFRSWAYRPRYMPPAVAIDIASDTPLAGPEFFYLGFQRGRPRLGQEPVDHLLPLRFLTRATVWRPREGASEASALLEYEGMVTFRDSDDHLLELNFDDADRGQVDLRPVLPLILRW